MNEIEFEGAEELNESERFQLDKIAESYLNKIRRKIKNDFLLRIKLKEYHRDGKKDKAHKFSIKAQIKTSTIGIDSEAHDWDLNRTLHAALDKLLSEIEHRFHVSEQGRE